MNNEEYVYKVEVVEILEPNDVKEMIERPQYPAPKFVMNKDVKNFYDFTVDDFALEDYQATPLDKAVEVAI